jgi:hypothetical protein
LSEGRRLFHPVLSTCGLPAAKSASSRFLRLEINSRAAGMAMRKRSGARQPQTSIFAVKIDALYGPAAIPSTRKNKIVDRRSISLILLQSATCIL